MLKYLFKSFFWILLNVSLFFRLFLVFLWWFFLNLFSFFILFGHVFWYTFFNDLNNLISFFYCKLKMLVTGDWISFKNFFLCFFFLYPSYWLLCLIFFVYTFILKYFILFIMCLSNSLCNTLSFYNLNYFFVLLKTHYNSVIKFYYVLDLISFLGLYDFLSWFFHELALNFWYFVSEDAFYFFLDHASTFVLTYYDKYEDIAITIYVKSITFYLYSILPILKKFNFYLIYFSKYWSLHALRFIVLFIPFHSWRTFLPKFWNYSLMYSFLIGANAFYFGPYLLMIGVIVVPFLGTYLVNGLFFITLNSIKLVIHFLKLCLHYFLVPLFDIYFFVLNYFK